MSNLDHIVLYTLLFGLFYLITRIDQKTINKHFWLVTALPIAFYSFVVGSRYWGADFEWYKLRFENPYYYPDEDPGFLALNLFLREFGLNYTGAYMSYAFMLIVSAYVLCKDFKENKYMLALFLPATLLFTTDIIRQSVAYCFMLIAMHGLFKKNYILYALMLIISYTIHPVTFVVAILCTALYFLSPRFKVLPYRITIPLYVSVVAASSLFTTFVSQIFTTTLTPVLGVLGGKYDGYADKADVWFGEDAIRTQWEQGFVALILYTLFNCAIIYLGYVALKYKPNDKVERLYNITVIGIISNKLFSLFELLRRIVMPLYMLYFIPLGYSLSFMYQNINKLQPKERKLSYISIVFIIIYLVAYWGRFIYLSPDYIFNWQK